MLQARILRGQSARNLVRKYAEKLPQVGGYFRRVNQKMRATGYGNGCIIQRQNG
jgi:DNA polymerase I-like protein with 3'-5' exonuclease and polymerase domains